MDDELLQLEAELKRLRPAAPSRELVAQLERELAPPDEEPGSFRAWWLLVGALAFMSWSDGPPGVLAPATLASSETAATDSSPLAPFQPVSAENVLYAARDEGPVTLADGSPGRRERLNYVDTITWKNPRTNASVRWSVPREEVRVVPVNFQ